MRRAMLCECRPQRWRVDRNVHQSMNTLASYVRTSPDLAGSPRFTWPSEASMALCSATHCMYLASQLNVQGARVL